MLTLRDSQVATLSADLRSRFVARLCEHARAFFPAEIASLSQDGLRRAVESCVERAARLGAHTQRDACRFLNLALAFGWDFDCDPDLTWIHRRLVDATCGTPSDRLAAIVAEALQRGNRAQADRVSRRAAQRSVGSPARKPAVGALDPPLMQGLLFLATGRGPVLGEAVSRVNAIGAHGSWVDDLPSILRELRDE